jgi:hypothetical protein
VVRDTRLALPPVRQKWLGVPVNEVTGSVNEIAARIPLFTRMPFAVKNNGHPAKENPYLDMIVQGPFNGNTQQVPVGVVSKSYTLLQHKTVFDRAKKAIKAADIELEEVRVDLKLTEHGERMALQFLFPEDFSITPSDGQSMSLRLQCINSVDGSHVFDATLGWFRFICSNGLVIGTVKDRFKKAHTEHLDITRIEEFLRAGIAAATFERICLKRWEATKIREEALRKWVDKPLRAAWGVKAAARAYHIALSGCDAELVRPFEKLPPSQRTMKSGARVPGAIFDSLTAFGVSQALSWLAKQRHELQEHLARERQIRPLIHRLIALN